MTTDPPNPADDKPPEDDKPKPPADDTGGNEPTDAERLKRAEGALSSERKARKKAEDELEKMRREGMDETQRAVAEAKAEGRAEALAEVNQRLVRAEVRALAGGKLADPADAVRLLDLDEFHIEDDGSIDAKQISAALDKLVEDKPYLAKATNGAPPKAPQGTRGTPGSPAGDPTDNDGDAWLRGVMKS